MAQAECDRIACHEAAAVHPMLLVRAELDETPMQLLIGLKICPGHAAETVPADLISDDGWKVIEAAYAAAAGRAPRRELTMVRFEPLDSELSKVMSGDS